MTGDRLGGGARWLRVGGIVLALLAVQAAGFSRWPLGGVRPELLLVFVLGFALQRGPREGGAVGFLAGLAADLISGHLVGLSAAVYGVAGLAAGWVGARLYPERWIVVLTVVAAGTVASQLLYVVGASAFGLPFPPTEALLRVTLSLVPYHLLLTPLVHPISRWAATLLAHRAGAAAAES